MKWLMLVLLCPFQVALHAQGDVNDLATNNSESSVLANESIGYIWNDSLLFSDSNHRISCSSTRQLYRHRRRYFDPKKKRHYPTSSSVCITDNIEAIYIEHKGKYASDCILLSNGTNILLISLRHHGRALYGYTSYLDKKSVLRIGWNAIQFSNTEESHYLSYGHHENDDSVERLGITQVFELIDNPASIELIPLPPKPVIQSEIELR